jgi:hypothetical protein
MKIVGPKLGSIPVKNCVNTGLMKLIAVYFGLAPNLILSAITCWLWLYKVGHRTIIKAIKKLRIIFDQLKADAFDEGHNAFEKMMNQIGVRSKGS